MAKMNGQTPEEMAADIVKAAVEPIVVEIDGVRGQELDELIRYRKAKHIYSKGEKWFQNNLEEFRKELLETIISAQFVQRKKMDEKQEKTDALEYFQLLVSRGVDKIQAMEMAGL
jgi:hypothetical protein